MRQDARDYPNYRNNCLLYPNYPLFGGIAGIVGQLLYWSLLQVVKWGLGRFRHGGRCRWKKSGRRTGSGGGIPGGVLRAHAARRAGVLGRMRFVVPAHGCRSGGMRGGCVLRQDGVSGRLRAGGCPPRARRGADASSRSGRGLPRAGAGHPLAGRRLREPARSLLPVQAVYPGRGARCGAARRIRGADRRDERVR